MDKPPTELPPPGRPAAHDRRYWFPAKKYGWGWGMPTMWQGWLVLTAFIALLYGGLHFIDVQSQPRAFLLYISALSAALVTVCWLTGAPPRWRWGDKPPPLPPQTPPPPDDGPPRPGSPESRSS